MGKRPLGKSWCRWEDNIKMDLQEVGLGGMDWTDLSQDRDRWRDLGNAATNLRVPLKRGEFTKYMRNKWLLKKKCLLHRDSFIVHSCAPYDFASNGDHLPKY